MVELAAARNAGLGITGFLHREEDMFFQYLEGPAAAVAAVFASIAADPRHDDVRLLGQGPLAVRRLADWSMGYSHHSGQSLFDWIAERAPRRGAEDAMTVTEFLVACAGAARQS